MVPISAQCLSAISLAGTFRLSILWDVEQAYFFKFIPRIPYY